MLLARTDPDRSLTHKGLSMFIVPKPVADGHGFEFVQEPGADRRVRHPVDQDETKTVDLCFPDEFPGIWQIGKNASEQ